MEEVIRKNPKLWMVAFYLCGGAVPVCLGTANRSINQGLQCAAKLFNRTKKRQEAPPTLRRVSESSTDDMLRRYFAVLHCPQCCKEATSPS